jgi:hypothetical protein
VNDAADGNESGGGDVEPLKRTSSPWPAAVNIDAVLNLIAAANASGSTARDRACRCLRLFSASTA